MKNKRLIIIAAAVPLLAVLGYLGLLWHAPSSRIPLTTDTTEQTPQPQSHSPAEQHTKPSGNAQPSDVPRAELHDDDPWIVFYNDSVERVIETFEKAFEKAMAKDGFTLSPEKRRSIRKQLAVLLEAKRAAGEAIPDLAELLDMNTQVEY